MAEQSILLVAVESPDLERVIGAARVPKLPRWSDEQFHSSNPGVPLNDRTDRFVTVVGVHPTVSRPDLALVEIQDGARMKRDIPLMRVLGHVVEVKSDFGTANSARESLPLQPLFEVRVDGKTIGALEGRIADLQELGTAAINLARDYISRRTAEMHHDFRE